LQEEISLASRVQKRQFGTQKKMSVLCYIAKGGGLSLEPKKYIPFCAKLQKEEVWVWNKNHSYSIWFGAINSMSKLFCWAVELTKKIIWKILKVFTIPTFCTWFASFLNLYTKLLETITKSFVPKFLFSFQRIQVKYLFAIIHCYDMITYNLVQAPMESRIEVRKRKIILNNWLINNQGIYIIIFPRYGQFHEQN